MLFVFDWDGTLCDSLDKIVRCVHLAAHQVGESLCSDEDVKSIIGLSLTNAISTLYPRADDDLVERMAAAYSAAFLADDSPLTLYCGAEETLSTLVDRGHTLAIATGKSRKGLDRVLYESGIEHFFSASRCADETESKPHPKMLFELSDELRFTPKDAVMVGDTSFDMEMAQSANMHRIAVSYGSHCVQNLHRFDLSYVADSLPDLLYWQYS